MFGDLAKPSYMSLKLTLKSRAYIIYQLINHVLNYQLINYSRYPTNKANPTTSSYPRNTKGRNGWKPCKTL